MTEHIVKLLIEERDRLNAAISALTGGVATKRRGRPPKNAVTATTENMPDWVKPTTAAPKKKARAWTAAQKKAAAERMAARWAAKKKAPAKKAAKEA